MKAFPQAVKPPRELRKITPDTSPEEAAALYAETLTAIRGVTDGESVQWPE